MKAEYNDADLRNEAPKLFGMDKKNPFEVPDGYFDSFSSKLQDKIAAEKKQSAWSAIFDTIIKPKIAIPILASVCLVAVGIKFMYKPSATINATNSEVTYSDLSQSSYFHEIDESTLTEALYSSNEIANHNAKTESDNNHIENYLIDNNIDAAELESALN